MTKEKKRMGKNNDLTAFWAGLFMTILLACLLVVIFVPTAKAQTEIACTHIETGVRGVFPCCMCPWGWE